MIREGKILDIKSLVKMGKDFFDNSGYQHIFPFEKKTFEKTVSHLITDENSNIFVAVEEGEIVGMAGALLFPFYMNENVLSCQEVFWWVKPEARKGSLGMNLLSGVEKWAKNKGAQTFNMMCLEHLNPDKVEKLLSHKGYDKTERHFMRVL